MKTLTRDPVGSLRSRFIKDLTTRVVGNNRPAWRCIICGALSAAEERPSECSECPKKWNGFDYPKGRK